MCMLRRFTQLPKLKQCYNCKFGHLYIEGDSGECKHPDPAYKKINGKPIQICFISRNETCEKYEAGQYEYKAN